MQERSELDPAELSRRLTALAQPAARARHRPPARIRAVRIKQEVGGVRERWKLGYLFDVIITRDAWMHRVDLSRADRRSPGAHRRPRRRHRRRRRGRVGPPPRSTVHPHLDGPAGGTFVAGSGGDEIHLDAVEFCRMLSGRATGHGLLTQEVPF